MAPMLRSLQKQRLLKMLNPESPPFKVLILDTVAQEILSPILRVSDLRDAGVTAHFLVTSARTPILDAPAFYFVSSIDGIVNDLNRDLYGAYYFNSSFSFKRSDLEKLAAVASEKRMAGKVVAVWDQFIQFIALQDDLFTLNIQDSFINRSDGAYLRKAVVGLMSLFYTMNEMPFIVSHGSELGKMLEQKIQNTRVIKSGIKKPLLIILNRDFDVCTPTKHVIGYVELLHDLFNIKLNKVDNISIDPDADFYKENSFLDFPTVTDRVERELHQYNKEMALRSLNENSDKAQIQAALDSAPHLQKRSDIVNSNLNLCTRILEQAKSRKIDTFYTLETNFDTNEMNDLADAGTENDVIRLCVQLIGTKNADQIDTILKKRRMSTRLLDYFRSKIKSEQGFGSRMKSLLFKRNLPIYTLVESIFTQVKSQNFGDLETFDPSYTGLYQSEISRIVVYVNGGATYSELKELKELEKTIRVPIILGGSEILNADEFIRQVSNEM